MSKKIATSLDLSSNRIQNLGIGSEASDAVNKSQLDLKVTANSNITAGTNTKITYDSKGLVTSGTNLSASDIPNININQVNTLQTDLDSKLDNISLIGEYTQLKPVFGSGQTSKLTASAANNSAAQGWTKLYSWSPAAYNKLHLMLHATSGGRGTLTGVVSVSFMQEANATTISAANITSEHIAGTVSNFSLIYNTASSMIELWYNDTFGGNQQTVFSPIKISGAPPTAYYGVSQASLPAYSTKFNSIDLHVDYLEGLTGNVQDQIDDCFNDDPFDIQPTTDLNSIVNSGSYRIYSSVGFSATYNQPVGAYTYGQLRVFVGRVGQVYQEYHPDRSVNTNDRTVYRRNKYATSNAWSDWVRDVTTDDLNAKQPLDSTLTALAGLSSGIPLLTSDSVATSINRATLVESLRSNSAISGGGVISVSSSYYIKWSTRFIVIDNGKGSHFSTTGYFDISMPSSGTVITGLGTPNKTVDANGILLGTWDALYYILPIGSTETTVNANFRLVNYQYVTEIPETWVCLASRNSDTEFVQFPNGVCLYAGESRTDHWQKQINSKQNKLTFDGTPTANSSNPVTSSGINDALWKKVDKVAIGGIWNYGGVGEGRWRGVAVIDTVGVYNGGLFHVVTSSRGICSDIYIRCEGGDNAIGCSNFTVVWSGVVHPTYKAVLSGYKAYIYMYECAWWQTSILRMEVANNSACTINYYNYDSTVDPGSGISPVYVDRLKLQYVNNLTSDAQEQINGLVPVKKNYWNATYISNAYKYVKIASITTSDSDYTSHCLFVGKSFFGGQHHIQGHLYIAQNGYGSASLPLVSFVGQSNRVDIIYTFDDTANLLEVYLYLYGGEGGGLSNGITTNIITSTDPSRITLLTSGNMLASVSGGISAKYFAVNPLEEYTATNGNLVVGGGNTISGTAHVGTWSSNPNYARFGHKDFNTVGGFGFLQRNDGAVFIETPASSAITLRQNGIAKLNITSDGYTQIVTPPTSADDNTAVTSAWVKDVASPISHTHTTTNITDLSTTLSKFTSKFSYKYSTIDGVNLWTEIASFTVTASTTYNFGLEFSMAGDDFPWESSPINMYVTIRDTFIDVCGICTSNKSPQIGVYYGISNGVAKVYLHNWSNWVTCYSGTILYDSHNVVNFASSSTTEPATGYKNIYTYTTIPRIITAQHGTITTYTDGVIYIEY